MKQDHPSNRRREEEKTRIVHTRGGMIESLHENERTKRTVTAKLLRMSDPEAQLAAHGYPRFTLDIDFFVLASPDNARAVIRALKRFGAPLSGVSLPKSDGRTTNLFP